MDQGGGEALKPPRGDLSTGSFAASDPPAGMHCLSAARNVLNRLSDEEDLYQFASRLEAARALYRACPELITTPEFPQRFRQVLSSYGGEGFEPDDTPMAHYVWVLDQNYREHRRQEAVEDARRWMEERRTA
ncbi:MAG TPA: hypothetical protein VIY49_37520 [Bryobacteraceae bacterium]